MVHKLLRILTLYGYLTHVRHVEDTAVLTYSVVLLNDRRILDWHVESAKRTDQGSQSHVFVIKTSFFIFHFKVDYLVVYFMINVIKSSFCNPWMISSVLSGKAALRDSVSIRTSFNPANRPFRSPVRK